MKDKNSLIVDKDVRDMIYNKFIFIFYIFFKIIIN